MRRTLLSIFTGLLTGLLALGVAWATAGLTPPGPDAGLQTPGPKKTKSPSPSTSPSPTPTPDPTFPPGRLPDGVFLVGAHNESIAPIPVSEGGPWNAHGDGYDCGPIEQEYLPELGSLVPADVRPRCGRRASTRHATSASTPGRWPISNGEDTLVFVGPRHRFVVLRIRPVDLPRRPRRLQPQDTCGTRAITHDLSARSSASPSRTSSSLRHTRMRVPTPRLAARPGTTSTSATRSRSRATRRVASMEPAQAADRGHPGQGVQHRPPHRDPRGSRCRADVARGRVSYCRRAARDEDETIATLVNFSAHPTVTAGNHDMHSGFIGHLAKRLERAVGRQHGLHAGWSRRPDRSAELRSRRDRLRTGRTRRTSRRRTPPTRSSRTRSFPSSASSRSPPTMPRWSLSTRSASSCGTRPFPAPTRRAGCRASSRRGGARTPSCAGASAISVLSPVGGFRIGTPGIAQGQPGFVPGDRGDAVVMMQAPGEIFASISLTTKDYLSRARNVMVFGMANDHIGYIIPAEQYDVRGSERRRHRTAFDRDDELRRVPQHRALHRRPDPERAGRDRHEPQRSRPRRGPLAS